MAKYRIGVIGCGGIGREHARAYLTITGNKIVTGVEVNQANAKIFADRYGVKSMYSDYKEMLKKEHLDFVSVCTWPRTHCEIVVAAAEAGVKGIMCEKPMAISLGEADKMIKACDKAGTKLSIGHQHRWDPQSVVARKLIAEGAIGTPVLFWGHCSLDLMNNGTHVVDLLNYFNGDVPAVWVIGQIDWRNRRIGAVNHPDMPIDDVGVGNVKYENGLRVVIELGEFAPQSYQFHLIGSDGIIDVNAPGEPTVKMLSKNKKGWVYPETTPADPRKEEMVELITAVEEKRESLSSGRIGRAALEIIQGIYESSKRRALIEMPVKAKDFVFESMIKDGII